MVRASSARRGAHAGSVARSTGSGGAPTLSLYTPQGVEEMGVQIKDMLGVTCLVKLVEPKTIQRSEGKAKRVIDNRKL